MNRKNLIKKLCRAIGVVCLSLVFDKVMAMPSILTGDSISITANASEIPFVTLINGRNMPMLGLGTYTLRGDTAVNAVKTALQMGYRMIDAAQAYHNEAAVYEGIRQSSVKREDVFVTTKVSPKNMGEHRVRESLEESVAALGGYIDLLLIHFPVKGEGLIRETWQIMEELVDNGKIRAIGISSFKKPHIDELMKYARIKPAVNQIEIHPYFSEQELTGYNLNLGIVVEGWSPFGSGKNGVLNDPTLERLAKKYNRSVAQIILRWHMQRGILAIPRTTNPDEMAENMHIFDFELSPVDMSIISGLNRNEMWEPQSDPDVRPWE